jgi:hypothetical protein
MLQGENGQRPKGRDGRDCHQKESIQFLEHHISRLQYPQAPPYGGATWLVY